MNILKGLKEYLKRVLPMPARSLKGELDRLDQTMDSINRAIEEQASILVSLKHSQLESIENLKCEYKACQNYHEQALTNILQNLDEFQENYVDIQHFNQLSQVILDRLINLQEQMCHTQDFDKFQKKYVETTDSILKDIQELHKKQENSFQKTSSVLKHIEQVIPNKTIYWSNKSEREIVEKNWGNVTEQADFPERFVKLTKNLDDSSIEKIIRIIIRQKAYLSSAQEKIDFFTRQEQEELRLLEENFSSEILKLSDNLYAYKSYLLPINHFESSVFYYKHGLDDLQTLKNVEGKSIIDVGGFIGDSVLVFSKLNPSKIYTFEAVPDNFRLLKKTLELNHIENVIAENVALGAQTGKYIMHIAGSGSTSIDRPGINYRGDIEVPVVTLDDYVEQHHIDIGLIKVDIEGGEPNFLEGAKHTICTQKPILLISIYHNAHDFFELKPLIESWDLGYKFKIHKPTYGNITSETLLLAEII